MNSMSELVSFSEVYGEALSSAFRRGTETGGLGLPQPAFDVRVFRILEAEQGRPALAGRRRKPDIVAAIRSLHAADLYLALAVCESIPEAIKRFRDWYGPTVRAVTGAIGGKASWSNDLANSLWIAVMGSPSDLDGPPPLLAAYDGRAAFKTWIRVVALRAAKAAGKRPRLGRRPEAMLVNAANTLLRGQERQALNTALTRTLQPESVRDRLLYRLVEDHDLSYTEAAHMLGTTPSAVQTAVHRLRKRLKLNLEQTLREEHSYDNTSIIDYWKRAARLIEVQ
jgi:DNA-directed RNA polymerase specialized sigma24 family protein